jgi:hypothetical protein
MQSLETLNFAHPRKKNGFSMREVKVYIYSMERVVSFKAHRPNQNQSEPDYVCVCNIPDLDFVDTRGYLMSLLKRVHRERMNTPSGYLFDFRVH